MDTIDAINSRRSIRSFKPEPLPEGAVKAILEAAIQAPSGKNRQPWEFIVVGEDKRDDMIAIMNEGIHEFKSGGGNVGSAENTTRIMQQAPVTIFIFNPYGKVPWEDITVEQRIMELVDVQSAGAAIQNMLLTATQLGIGSLWICDVFFAYEGLCKWLNRDDAIVAAVSFGYTDEKPDARPRKSMDEVTRWL